MKTLTTIEMVEEDGSTELNWVGSTPDAAAIERLIQELGRMRRDTNPPIPKQLLPGTKVVIEPEIGLMIGKDFSGKPLMSFRHPGFGWCTFHFPPAAQNYVLQEIRGL